MSPLLLFSEPYSIVAEVNQLGAKSDDLNDRCLENWLSAISLLPL